MSDQNPHHPASDPSNPQGLPARQQKPEDKSVVSDLTSELDDPTPQQPQPPKQSAPDKPQRTIRQRRSRSRSHWNLDKQDTDAPPSKAPSIGWFLGLAALITTTIGGIVVIFVTGLSGFSSASGPPRELQMALFSLEQGDIESARTFISSTPPDLRTGPYFYSIATRLTLANKDAMSAKKYLEDGLASYPDDPLMLIAKAEVALAEGDPATAAATAQTALDMDPELNIAWRILGQSQAAQGDLNGALASLNQSLAIAPNSVASVTTAAQIHTELGNPQDADRLFRTTLQEYSNSDLSITYAGYLRKRGDVEAAGEALDNALQRNPKHLRLLSFRARLHMENKNYAAAQETLKQATSLDSKNPNYWIELGNAYGADERYLDAANAFKKAVELAPENPTTHYNLGYALLLQEDYPNAEPHLLETLAINPDYGLALQGLARLYQETFQDEKAEEIKQKIAALLEKGQQQPPPQQPE